MARFVEMLANARTLRSHGLFGERERDDRRRRGPSGARPVIQPHLVEWVDAEQAQGHVAAWTDLAARALESNVFLNPAFALPAASHVSGRRRPAFLLVWDRDETTPRRRLLALWPLLPPRPWFGAVAETWVHDYCCSGAPLLDRTHALACLNAIAAFLRDSPRSASCLSATQLRADGPTVALLRRFAGQGRLAFQTVAQTDRAALDATQTGLNSPDFVTRKKSKDLQRQLRRLGDRGPVAIGVAREGDELLRQIENFLILEAKGWKGRHGGAFLNRRGHADFVRAMAQTLGPESHCRVYWMSVADKVIASNIVLFDDPSAYFWKTAYDEDFASASPGVLLTMSMTGALLRESGVRSVDSCAVSAHPMIDHIWRERTPMADVMLSLRPGRMDALKGAVRRERWRRALREKAKATWARFRPA
jgi:CelD/BcsL family acetyltransferase involved in cellulose biosynthesis